MAFFDDLKAASFAGSGGSPAPQPTLITKSVTANGTYSANDDSADGYSQVSVSVPNSYAAQDEGKVVSNGALVAQTSDTVTENGTVDTTLINSLTVNVSGSGGTAYYTKFNRSESNKSSLGFGIVGDKGTNGTLFVAIDGGVNPNSSTYKFIELSDFNLSDYLTNDITITMRESGSNSLYFYLTFEVQNNRIVLSQGNFMSSSSGYYVGFKTTTL